MKKYLFTLLLFASYSTVSAQHSEPLFRIIEDGKFGFINQKGKVVIPPEFSYAYDFSDGLAYARKEGKYGYINTKGKWQVPPTFSYFPAFVNYKNTITILRAKDSLLAKNPQLRLLIKENQIGLTQEQKIYTFSVNFKYGLFDKSGKILLEPQFSIINPFVHHRAVVEVSEDRSLSYGVIDSFGKYVMPLCGNCSISEIGGGFLQVTQYPDSTNRQAPQGKVSIYTPSLRKIDFQFPLYPFTNRYSEGLISVCLPKKPLVNPNPDDFYVAFADTLGHLVLNDTSVLYATRFQNGLSVIFKDHHIQCMDMQGKGVPNISLKWRGHPVKQNYEFESEVDQYIRQAEGKIVLVVFDDKQSKNYQVVYNHTGQKMYEEENLDDYGTYYPFGGGIWERRHGKVKMSLTSPYLPYYIENFDKGGAKGGLLCLVNRYGLSYVDKKGNTVWRQKKRYGYDTRDIQYYSDELDKGAKIISLPGYACGKETEPFKLVNTSHTEAFKGDSLRYHFKLVNTTCDTLQTNGLKVRLFHQHMDFGSRPSFYDMDCMLVSDNGLQLQPIPPRHALEFSVRKTRGRFKSEFQVNVQTELYSPTSHSLSRVRVESEDLEGMITQEVYGTGWYDSFIDEFFYKNLHEAYQTPSHVDSPEKEDFFLPDKKEK